MGSEYASEGSPDSQHSAGESGQPSLDLLAIEYRVPVALADINPKLGYTAIFTLVGETNHDCRQSAAKVMWFVLSLRRIPDYKDLSGPILPVGNYIHSGEKNFGEKPIIDTNARTLEINLWGVEIDILSRRTALVSNVQVYSVADVDGEDTQKIEPLLPA